MSSLNLNSYEIFENEVKDNFDFLIKQYGFQISKIEQTNHIKLIRYESSIIYVNLIYGSPAYEPELSFGRIGIDDLPGVYSFDQGDLILLKNSEGWEWSRTNPNNSSLVEIILGLSQVLKECGPACLDGKQSVFEEMKVRRDEIVKKQNQQDKVNQIKKQAHLAWANKDYKAVVKVYKEIEDMLNDTEKKKLNFAKKHQ